MEDFEQLIDEDIRENQSHLMNTSLVYISSEEDVVLVAQPKTPERTRRNILDSTLSPKLTDIEHSDGRVSRYGRHQKSKALEDGFIPTDLTRFLSKTGPKMLKPVTFETMRIIKTPTKVYPEHEIVVNNNNESSEKMLESKEMAGDDGPEEDLGVDSSGSEKIGNKSDEEPRSQLSSQLDVIEQMSDVDSGRGSSIDPEFAALMAKYQEGEIYWAEYSGTNWWPCIIAPDPDAVVIRNNNKMRNFEIHVKYFADKRAWISVNKLVPYKPFEDLKKTHKVRCFHSFIIF